MAPIPDGIIGCIMLAMVGGFCIVDGYHRVLGSPVRAVAVIFVSMLIGMVCKWCKRRTLRPLDFQLATHRKNLRRRHPKLRRLDRGPLRGIKVSQLEEFHDCIRSFTQWRTLHFVVSNIITPITKEEDVSYAELAGPVRLDWFISHNCSSPFQDFVQDVVNHAKWADDGHCVWICSFANNQHRKGIEIGDDWKQSPLYLALKDPSTKGTATVMNDEADTLTRIWCVFELFQTIEFKGPGGLLLCTSTGVLKSSAQRY